MSIDLCRDYVDEVMRFRKALNLTSVADPQAFEQRFIRPSLALAEFLPQQGRLLDIGSGMGIPGIPLLVARRSLDGVLVERRKKRAEFLRHVIRKLKLRAEAIDADVRDLPPLQANVCVARAVTKEVDLLQMCAPHMAKGGLAVLPVPLRAEPVQVSGWNLLSEKRVELLTGDEQLVRCYRYG